MGCSSSSAQTVEQEKRPGTKPEESRGDTAGEWGLSEWGLKVQFARHLCVLKCREQHMFCQSAAPCLTLLLPLSHILLEAVCSWLVHSVLSLSCTDQILIKIIGVEIFLLFSLNPTSHYCLLVLILPCPAGLLLRRGLLKTFNDLLMKPDLRGGFFKLYGHVDFSQSLPIKQTEHFM